MGMSHRKDCAVVPVLSSRAMAQRSCQEDYVGLRAESSESLPKGAEFICNMMLKISSLKALSKIVEVVVKGNLKILVDLLEI